MTLAEIADHICDKVNQTEDEDVSACRGFVRQRRDMIWAEGLWRTSLFEYTQTLDDDGYIVTDTWLPTKKTLLLPVAISHVLAARTDTAKLNVESSEIFYRTDFDTFASTGSPRQFGVLPPCVWEFESSIVTQTDLDVDNLPIGGLVLDYLASDGTTITRLSTTINAEQFGLPSTSRIDSITKPVTDVAIPVKNNSGTITIFTIPAADTGMGKRQRIQLFGTIADGTVIRVLGKAKPPTFTADNDEAGINGVDNCLIAFGQADMLERERRYGQAQAKKGEGVDLLQQLKRVETVQQAHHQRLIPENGYGWEFDSNSTHPLSW